MNSESLPLAERVARLEGALGWSLVPVRLLPHMAKTAAALLIGAGALLFVGMGPPNHHYQLVFATLTVLLCYHRGIFARASRLTTVVLVTLDIVVLSMLYKILIGLGRKQPLAWIQVPRLEAPPVGAEQNEWFRVVPPWTLNWEPAAASTWVIDLTVVQTFLFLLTLLAALFNFQPFASFTAILLVLLSLPSLLGFGWEWVFWGIILTGVAFYLQTSEANRESSSG